MATKTFKIGEVCKGGIITAIATKERVTIIAKDWDHSQGTKRGSNQTNAKEWDRLEVELDTHGVYVKLYHYLADLSTHFWAEKIIDWVETKTDITAQNRW
jgi:hypothetical protein